MQVVSQEVYEQVRAQVLEELKAERLARSQENERIRTAACHMFDDLKTKYMPLLLTNVMKEYPNRRDHYILALNRFDYITQTALSAIGERDEKHAYRNGKAEESIQMAEKMLLDMYKEKDT